MYDSKILKYPIISLVPFLNSINQCLFVYLFVYLNIKTDLLKKKVMKSKFALIILVLIPFLGIKAQQPIVVTEDTLAMGKFMLPGLSVTIPETNYDVAVKAWVKDLQSGTKSKVVTEKDEMSIFGARLKNISPNPVNIYSKFVKLDSMLKLYVSIETKKDEYIEKANNAEFIKVSDYIKEFAKNQYTDVAKAQADTEEKKLKDLQKELSSLENEKSKMLKTIQTDNSDILSAKDNITAQNSELNSVEASLKEQNSLLAGMEAGPAQKEKATQVKDLEKRKKKALNEIESSEKKIKKSNEAIEEANKAIPENELMQEKVREQIVLQEAVYQKYAAKLKTIKSY